MRQTILVAASLLAGFVGGGIGGRLLPNADQDRPQRVVRAQSFELLDPSGKVI